MEDASLSIHLQGRSATAPGIARPSIAVVASQYAEDTIALRHTRSVLVRAPHVKLHRLRRLDDRIAAHLDGLAVAGPQGWKLAQAALESAGPGQVFAATVLAIENGDPSALDRLLALAEAHRPASAGLVSAFGWVSARGLRGIASAMLSSGMTWHRQVGLAACVMHRIDPGRALDLALTADDTVLRTRALWVTSGLGRRDCLPLCVDALADQDSGVRFHAVRSAWLLGDRNDSLSDLLESFAVTTGPDQQRALGLLLKVGAVARSHASLNMLAADATQRRTLMRSVGIAGDPRYVPWLIEQMSDLALARLAGESFSLITGLDLAQLDLELKPPVGMDFGPSDDPEDADVAMDEDDSLPWPDPIKISAWWNAHGVRFASGRRYFMGAEPGWDHCVQVLRDGFQRQRIAAAEYLCLLRPGTALFQTAAPAWRQKRWLDEAAD